MKADKIERGDRTITAIFVKEKVSDDKEIQVALSVSHGKSSKSFNASLREQTKERQGGFTSTSFMLFDSKLVARESVARFSQKRLEEFFAKTLAEVEDSEVLADMLATEGKEAAFSC